MYMLQLFDQADEVQPIDARLLRDGMISIGRGSTAEWSIADPDSELSRTHCEIEVSGERLSLRALGSNGVFDQMTGDRFPNAVDIHLPIPTTLRLGRFLLRATRAVHTAEPLDMARTMVLTPPLGESIRVPSNWSDAAPARTATSGSLLDAFCDGAGLDASLLSRDDPAEVLRRAGAVYRQMVLGMADLMSERDRARARYKLTRTTIGGANNNPFKWAPNQRLAVDLLLARSDSFLSGPAAMQSTFADLTRHLIATFAGLHGSLRAAIAAFDPGTLNEASAKRGALFKSRAAAQVEEAAARHADLLRQIEQDEEGSLDRAFVAAYCAAEARANREADA
jgi:predicted component of type VI protein secretion system